MIRVGIVGITGYAGGELARWVLQHPGLELGMAISRSAQGRPLGQVVPSLLDLTELSVQGLDADLGGLDVVAVATPHGVARALVPALVARGARHVVDLSADHRHADGWVYGQPEWHGERLEGAERVAVPGCFATAISLALAPLARAGVLCGSVCVQALTGSTGSGATPSAGTHHPARFANVRAYKVLRHQHVPEIRAFLGGLGQDVPIDFVPASGPFDRGIFATCFASVDGDLDVSALFADTYGPHPLVRLRSGTPELRFVRGTGFCDLSVHQDGDRVVLLSAIDNLGRGAAAQAIQCIEHIFGLPSALRTPPCIP